MLPEYIEACCILLNKIISAYECPEGSTMVDLKDEEKRLTVTDRENNELLSLAAPTSTPYTNPEGSVTTTIVVNMDTDKGDYTLYELNFAIKGSQTYEITIESPDGRVTTVPEVRSCNYTFENKPHKY